MDKVMRLMELTVVAIVLFCLAIVSINQHNLEVKMSQEIATLRLELKESQEQCKRMADTCIDILANKRWE